MKKSCYLLSLMLFLSVAVFGQTQSEGFSNDLKEYAEKRVAGEDSAFSLLRINDVYKQGDDAAQSNYREAIKQAVATSLRANENRQALELINLYDFLVPESTNRAPELYLIEGTIHSRQNDSVRLKESIAKLEALGRGETMLQRLNGYLEQMRNYISADKFLEGYWVSDLRAVQNWRGVAYPIEPFCMFKAEQTGSTPLITLVQPSPYLHNLPLGMPESKKATPQVVLPFSTDSIYICWSSERLRDIDPENVSSYRNIVRESSAQAQGVLAQRHVYSNSERLANGLLVGLFEQGANSLISALSTPNKIVTIMQLRIRRINDRLYQGTLHYYWGSVSAEGKKKENDWEQPVTLHRWDVESGIVFSKNTGSLKDIFVSQTEEIHKAVAKEESGIYRQHRAAYNRSATPKKAYERLAAFNTAQYRQLEIYNQRLLDPSQTPIIVVPEGMRMCGWLGATVRKVSAEEVAANKWSDDRGLWIESMAEASPAFVAGFREGDVIRTVGGVAVNTPEELAQKIKSYPAGAELTIELMRKDKLLSRIVRLSYQFTPKDE